MSINTKRSSALSHWKVHCYRHDIPKTNVHWTLNNNHSLTKSILTHLNFSDLLQGGHYHLVEAAKPKYFKVKWLKIFGSKKTKGHKQNRQNRLKSSMPNGGEPDLLQGGHYHLVEASFVLSSSQCFECFGTDMVC
jgi:hypothetical protein